MTTAVASLRRWVEAVNEMNGHTFFLGKIAENIPELTKGNVTDLATPKLPHGFDVQRFEEDDIEMVSQVMSQFEVPVPPSIRDCFMRSRKISFGGVPMFRLLNLARETAACFANVFQARLKPSWRFNLLTVRHGEESSQSEVDTDDVVTRSVGHFDLSIIDGKADEQFAQWVTFHGDGLDRAKYFSRLTEFVDQLANANLIATHQFPTGLFQGEAGVFLDLAKARTVKLLANLSGFVLKEKLIAVIDSFANLLYCLTSHLAPKPKARVRFTLGKMLLQPIDVDVLARQPIVAPMQGNTAIPNYASYINLVMQFAILFRLIQLVFQRDHTCFWFSIYSIMTASGAPPTVQTK